LNKKFNKKTCLTETNGYVGIISNIKAVRYSLYNESVAI
jgi:non-canonical (house-cleaning) NTP pyrophosphatase